MTTRKTEIARIAKKEVRFIGTACAGNVTTALHPKGNHMVDSQGRKWEVMEREDGSVVCYYTREGNPAHWVVWDSVDHLATVAQEYYRCETCGTLLRVLFHDTPNP
jgi:hypothetical protein